MAAPGPSCRVASSAPGVRCWRRRTGAQGFDGDLLVLFGDAPLLSAATLKKLMARIKSGADIAALGFRAADPTGYGRMIVEDDRVSRIVEEKDASPSEARIDLCFAGMLAGHARDDVRAARPHVGNQERARRIPIRPNVIGAGPCRWARLRRGRGARRRNAGGEFAGPTGRSRSRVSDPPHRRIDGSGRRASSAPYTVLSLRRHRNRGRRR